MSGIQTKLPVFDLDQIRASLVRDDILAAVREAFVRHARGEVVSPVPGQLLFNDPPGDCHIKYGRFHDGPTFVVKIAMGFYENAALGLPVNNGLVAVFDARTGATLAILQDAGWLTSWRTAAAGALAAVAGAPAVVTSLGIVGAGHQAENQARWVAPALGTRRVAILGRYRDEADRIVGKLRGTGLDAMAVDTVGELFGACNVVVTCTPSSTVVVPASVVRPGTHIVGLGADSPGKQELDPALFSRADVIMTDDHDQCVDHGDFSHAVRLGLAKSDTDVSLGAVLAGLQVGRRRDDDITIADLTGIAAQDIAIATLAWERLSGRIGASDSTRSAGKL